MHKHFCFRAASTAALALPLLLLAACNSEPTTIEGSGPADPDAQNVAAAAPVQLPPAVIASRTYRCKDNSLIYVDFFNNNTALYRTEKDGTPTTLTAPEAGKPYVADGYSVSGSGTQVSITAPGKGTETCKA